MQEMVPMGNPLIEGPIPLSGAGFIAKENGNFQPGEYKRLSNVEIKPEGILANRRNVYSVHGENTGVDVNPIVNPHHFMGNMREYSLLAQGENQYIVGDSTFLPLWTLADGFGPVGATSYSIFLGFFRYNNKNFWLVLEFESVISISLSLYYDDSIPVPDLPETYGVGYEASLTRTVILSFPAGTTDFFDFQYKNFFIYKERLWIATSVGLYFSAATDPTNFLVPDGGFFKHPGNRVNYSMAIKDQIYTLCEDAVYALTYNTDPNLDATERPLSDSIGGEMGCVHLDTPYFINNMGIYVINGTNVDKVMDSKFDYGKDVYRNHLYSFEDYLVINKYSPINYDNNYSPPARVSTRQNLILHPESDAVGGSQIITGWVSSGSPALTLRENLQINPNVNLDPSTAPSDYVSGTTSGKWALFKSDVNYYLAPSGGYVARNSTEDALDISVYSPWHAAVEAETFTASAYIMPGTPNAYRTVKLKLHFSGADLVPFDTEEVSIDAEPFVWTRIHKTVTTPAGTVNIRWSITYEHVSSTSAQAWDAVLFEKTGSLKSYFDGDFADSAFRLYSWSGVAHESKSVLTVNTVNMDPISAPVVVGVTGKVMRLSGTFVNPGNLEGETPSIYGRGIKTFDPTTALLSGIPYTFRFDYRGLGTWPSEGSLEVKLEYLSAADVVLGSSVFTELFDVSTSFNVFSRDSIVFPGGTEKMRVIFTFTLDISSALGTTLWYVDFNKFLLEKTSTFSGYFTGATMDTPDVTYAWVSTPFESESTTGSATSHSYLKNNGSKFDPFIAGNSLGYNTYFINTENGAAHVLDFMDQYIGPSQAGFIVDAIVNSNSDSSGNGKIFFLTNKQISEDESGLTYESNVYYQSTSEDINVYDFAVNAAGILIRRPPKIDIEWDSFVPDGLEYRFKKFRSLLLQGLIPNDGIQLEVAYDNSTVFQITDLGDDLGLLSVLRSHYPHRIGLNQRARSITLRLSNTDWISEINGSYGYLEISDFRVLWTYTEKLPSSRFIGS
jgi:hypothetical protein